MASPFNPAQQQVIDRILLHSRTSRPTKRMIRSVWAQCRQLGPEISAQEIGRYYANLAAASAGRPRATRKIASQIRILRRSFDDDAFPTTLQTIFLVHATGLDQKQVKQWFDHQRKKSRKIGEELFTRNEENNTSEAAKLWREYNKDPEAFAERYFERDEDGGEDEEGGDLGEDDEES